MVFEWSLDKIFYNYVLDLLGILPPRSTYHLEKGPNKNLSWANRPKLVNTFQSYNNAKKLVYQKAHAPHAIYCT